MFEELKFYFKGRAHWLPRLLVAQTGAQTPRKFGVIVRKYIVWLATTYCAETR